MILHRSSEPRRQGAKCAAANLYDNLREYRAAATVVRAMPKSRRSLAAAALISLPFVFPASPAAAQARHEHSHAAPKKKPAKPVEKAFGREGDPRRVRRTIKVDMSDTMRYFPEQIRVRRGDTVRFNVHNSGQLPHEMVLGTMDELKKHAVAMRRQHEGDATKDHHHVRSHGHSYMAYVEPGDTRPIVWHFTKAGEFYYACLIPGHFEAGMIGTIVVR